MGVEVRFEATSPLAIELIDGEYGHWRRDLGDSHLVRSSPATIRIVVRASGPAPATQLHFEYVVPTATRMSATCEGGTGEADSSTLEANVVVDEWLLENGEAFTRGLVEPLLLFLVVAQDREPLHAAAVLRDDVAVVLAGPSGTGKSTLVYAATKRGYLPLADDPVYIQLQPTLRVWGRRGSVHLRPEASTFFPELTLVRPHEIPGGKVKLVVDPGGRRRHADRVGLCILRRQVGGRALLTPISPEEAARMLTARLDEGFDLFRESIGTRIAKVAERGAWIIELGASPLDALDLLDEAASAIASHR